MLITSPPTADTSIHGRRALPRAALLRRQRRAECSKRRYRCGLYDITSRDEHSLPGSRRFHRRYRAVARVARHCLWPEDAGGRIDMPSPLMLQGHSVMTQFARCFDTRDAAGRRLSARFC